MVTVRVSGEARIALLRRVEQVAREYDEQHGADARLPLEQRAGALQDAAAQGKIGSVPIFPPQPQSLITAA
jgi:hypothetical protein